MAEMTEKTAVSVVMGAAVDQYMNLHGVAGVRSSKDTEDYIKRLQKAFGVLGVDYKILPMKT